MVKRRKKVAGDSHQRSMKIMMEKVLSALARTAWLLISIMKIHTSAAAHSKMWDREEERVQRKHIAAMRCELLTRFTFKLHFAPSIFRVDASFQAQQHTHTHKYKHNFHGSRCFYHPASRCAVCYSSAFQALNTLIINYKEAEKFHLPFF